MKGFVEVNTNSALVQLVSFFAENKVLPYTPITTNFAFLWLFLELLGDKIRCFYQLSRERKSKIANCVITKTTQRRQIRKIKLRFNHGRCFELSQLGLLSDRYLCLNNLCSMSLKLWKFWSCQIHVRLSTIVHSGYFLHHVGSRS